MKDKNNLEPCDYKTGVSNTLNQPLEALKQMSAYHLEMGVAVKDLPNYDFIEKSLKALEIIMKKRICISTLIYALKKKDFKYYNYFQEDKGRKLTQAEFDLLKEVIKDYEKEN